MTRPAIDRRDLLTTGASALLAAITARTARADAMALGAELDRIRVRYGLPGAVAMVLRGGTIVAEGASGVRSVTSQDPVQLTDPFLLGSCGKSMTATIAARLVARGAVRFETALEEAFPELAPSMQPAYRSVPLEALLAHRGGMPAAPSLYLPLDGEPAMERARALPVILALPPQGLAGQTYLYSNLGYVVAGAMLERLAGVPFESLAAAELFLPLDLVSAGFLPPVSAEAPSGHTAFWLPLPPGSPLYPPAGASPAGLYRMALPDWAVYASLHFGLGPADYLAPELLGRLQQPWNPSNGEDYALGWHVDQGAWGRELRHNGSDGYWSARIRLIPALGYGVLFATNMFGFNVEPAADELEAHLLALFPPA